MDIQFSDNIRDALASIDGAAQNVATQLGLEIEARAQANAHVITGSMKEAVSLITPQFSHYEDHVSKAADLNPEAVFAPEAELEDGVLAVVQAPAGHSGFEEFGTSRQAAHPWFTPAVESVAADAEAIAREALGL